MLGRVPAPRVRPRKSGRNFEEERVDGDGHRRRVVERQKRVAVKVGVAPERDAVGKVGEVREDQLEVLDDA